MENKYFIKEVAAGGALTCPCGCDAKLSKEVISSLNELREEYGKPIYCEAGATCAVYSMQRVGRSPGSKHIDYGNGAVAIDIKHKTFKTKDDYFKFIGVARKVGVKGIGQSSSYFDVHASGTKKLHIDWRDSEDMVTWMYYK